MAAGASQPMEIVGYPAIHVGLVTQLWRRKLYFIVVFVSVLLLVGAAISVLPTRYLATGQIIVAEQEPLAGNDSAAWVQKLGDPADLESHLLRVRSPRLLRTVLNQTEIVPAIRKECEAASAQSKIKSLMRFFEADRGCDKLVASNDAMLDWMQSRYTTGSVGRSRVIAVAYQSPDPAVAQTMANSLISAYLADELAEKVESRSAATSWLWREIAQIGDDLRKQDLEIQAYRRQHGLVRGQVASVSSEQLTAMGQQLAVAQAAQAEAAARMREMAAGTGHSAADSREVLDSRTVADLKQELSTISGKIASLSQSVSFSHPSLIALRRQQADVQARIDRETRDIASSAQRNYAAATMQVTNLSRQLDALKQEVGSATDSEASIASMVRDAEIKRELYVDLYKKASQMETERRVVTGDTHLVNYAELPTAPSFPKRLPFAAAGLVAALIAAAAAALLKDRADHSVRASNGLELVTGANVLVQVPMQDRSASGLAAALRLVATPSMLQESIRSLYAQIVLAGVDGKMRTILVTSSKPQEGKTFTTLALAHFAAASGRKVLAIECDLRCPSFRNGLAVRSSPGLSEVLDGPGDFLRGGLIDVASGP